MSGEPNIAVEQFVIDQVERELAQLLSDVAAATAAAGGASSGVFGPTAAAQVARYHRDGAHVAETDLLQTIDVDTQGVLAAFRGTVEEFGRTDEAIAYAIQQAVNTVSAVFNPGAAAATYIRPGNGPQAV
ncbi:hypothetical protein RDV89_08210 [Nocardioides zeae]|uniref:PE domain-containing protein n=1 Tax=Nocardioides imazamoxiresistens TaxID=3231893 RepID=A0ABU3PUY8_9ACTN|nr:hypothetical protein [Nocardioides zeae]MDT9593047.1 hypothetical protein [Nocardioides zeae]